MWHGYELEARTVFERTETLLRANSLESTSQRYRLAKTLLFLDRFQEAGVIVEQLASELPEDGSLDSYDWIVASAAAGVGDRETALRISAE